MGEPVDVPVATSDRLELARRLRLELKRVEAALFEHKMRRVIPRPLHEHVDVEASGGEPVDDPARISELGALAMRLRHRLERVETSLLEDEARRVLPQPGPEPSGLPRGERESPVGFDAAHALGMLRSAQALEKAARGRVDQAQTWMRLSVAAAVVPVSALSAGAAFDRLDFSGAPAGLPLLPYLVGVSAALAMAAVGVALWSSQVAARREHGLASAHRAYWEGVLEGKAREEARERDKERARTDSPRSSSAEDGGLVPWMGIQ